MLERLISGKPFSTAMGYYISGAFWAIIGATFGLIAALSLIAPDLISVTIELTFGRLRPVHVNLVALGFVYTVLLGTGAYIVPKLCKVESLWNERLGNLNIYLWNVVFIGAIFTLLAGDTQARELAELPWWIDMVVAVSLLIYALNIIMTIVNRKERLLYVSIWYVAGGIIWTVTVYGIGNIIWNYPHGAIPGIMDAVWLWFYGHNVVGLILTPMAVAAAYYIIPRAVRRPVWSHTMSLIGFWVLLVVYTHTGTHHLIQAPVPQWLKVISIVDSFALLIPVFTVLLNLWLPMRGRMGVLHEDIGAKFVFLGTIWYAVVCLQGPLQSLPAVQKLTHFTHWVVAHAHIAILGFAGFIAIGSALTIVPLITGKKLASRRMADAMYWILLIGLGTMFLVLTAAGLIQGGGWLNGEAFYRILPQLNLYMILRALSGVVIVASMIMFFAIIIRTIRNKEELQTDEEVQKTKEDVTTVEAA